MGSSLLSISSSCYKFYLFSSGAGPSPSGSDPCDDAKIEALRKEFNAKHDELKAEHDGLKVDHDVLKTEHDVFKADHDG